MALYSDFMDPYSQSSKQLALKVAITILLVVA